MTKRTRVFVESDGVCQDGDTASNSAVDTAAVTNTFSTREVTIAPSPSQPNTTITIEAAAITTTTMTAMTTATVTAIETAAAVSSTTAATKPKTKSAPSENGSRNVQVSMN